MPDLVLAISPPPLLAINREIRPTCRNNSLNYFQIYHKSTYLDRKTVSCLAALKLDGVAMFITLMTQGGPPLYTIHGTPTPTSH